MAFALLFCCKPISPAGAQIVTSDKFVKAEGFISRDKVHPGETFKAAVVFEVQKGYHINADKPADNSLKPTRAFFYPPKGFTLGKVSYPKYSEKKFAFSAQPLRVFEGRQAIIVPVSAGAKIPTGKFLLKCRLQVQACSGTSCFAPASLKVTIPLEVVPKSVRTHEANTEIFSPGKKTGNKAQPPPNKSPTSGQGKHSAAADLPMSNLARQMTERGMLLTFVGLFFGGLALNLTPCVYPLIPITVGYFGGQSAGNSLRTFLLAMCYVLGIAITYSFLGVSSAMGGRLMGSVMQSPPVLLFIAAVLTALALSMFGLYEISPPSFLTQHARAKRGYIGSLAMGLLVGLVAAPCLAPVLVGLLTFVATTRNPLLGFWMFFILALGMGVPYIFLAVFATSVSALPRSGVWLVWVKKLFGVMLIAAGLYVVTPLLPPAITRWLIVGFLFLSGLLLGWLDATGASLPRFNLAKRLIGSAAMVVALWFMVRAPAGAGTGMQWERYSKSRLAEAAARRMPVIIDFYADWCVECKKMERSTFTDHRVIEKSRQFVLLKSNLTRNSDPQVREVSRQFRIIGLPTVVFLDRKGREVSELRVEGFLDADSFLHRMEKASK